MTMCVFYILDLIFKPTAENYLALKMESINNI